MMKEQFENSYLFGGNAPFVEELYEAWLEDAASVPESWKQYFEDLARQPGAAPALKEKTVAAIPGDLEHRLSKN